MGVIRTDKWLIDWYDKPIKICEQVKAYFHNVKPLEIYEYFILHGMYRPPFKKENEWVKKLQNNKVWDVVTKEKQYLEETWGGPDIPIFIFPSDPHNRDLKQNYNGKSGLAFKDKLFLFLSDDNKQKEIRALFTHEYNHVCWLAKYKKNEKDYVLLDTVILEGLAENAVRERFGEEYTANWTTYYSNQTLKKLWDTLVFPNRNILPSDRKHQDILYGFRFYPKMAGYCVGYYLVKKYMLENSLICKDLLHSQTDLFHQIKNYHIF
ncbi:DUF2268 domain-containing protein [Alteribacillus sp. JSM 102045]|uniref:DUF2268 domain-containing protein n=1 Tax=Alteribacillus sp. JSM 102045 TaxID=1562101 RepID=UPI0035C03330